MGHALSRVPADHVPAHRVLPPATPSTPGNRPWRMGLQALYASFLALALCASLLVGAVSFWGMRAAQAAADRIFVAKDVTADILPPPLYLIELRLALSQAIEGHLSVDQARGEIQRLKDEYAARVTHWLRHPPGGLQQHLLGAQHQAAQPLLDAAGPLLDAVASGNEAAARGALQAAHAAYLAHRAGVDATVRQAEAVSRDASAHLATTRTASLAAQALVLVAAGATLVLFGLWIRRAVMARVGGEPALAAALARAVAAGDLSVHLPVREGDARSIMAALNRMCEELRPLIADVRQSSENVASGSRQIVAGNADLSTRTAHQTETLQQAAASMEQLGSTVQRNADYARQANDLAQTASRVAAKGGVEVREVVSTMRGINDSSRRIADIIGVIDGIAFQTNILALNAAVEAARAGAQGRGFAVVASEVRTLAQRSAAAAREIKDLITSSVDRVEQGTALVDQAGATMHDVVEAIARVSAMVDDISRASAEQSTGVAQMAEAVALIDQDTQRNADLVQRSSAAADSLHQQAERLVRATAVFRLG